MAGVMPLIRIWDSDLLGLISHLRLFASLFLTFSSPPIVSPSLGAVSRRQKQKLDGPINSRTPSYNSNIPARGKWNQEILWVVAGMGGRQIEG